jgi:hypothetical protein
MTPQHTDFRHLEHTGWERVAGVVAAAAPA